MDEKTVRKLIVLAREKINRINDGTLPLSFKKKSIDQIVNDIEEYEELLLDEENFKRKIVPAAPIKIVEKPEVVRKIQQKTPYNSANRPVTEIEMQRSHDRYMNTTIPDNLLDKLKNMPQDRGFIFRKIHLYGHLPRKTTSYNNIILTERVGDKIMVHEYNSSIRSLDDMHDKADIEYKYYEKPKWEPRPQRKDYSKQKDFSKPRPQRNNGGDYRNENPRPQRNNGGDYRNENPRPQRNNGNDYRNENPRPQRNNSGDHRNTDPRPQRNNENSRPPQRNNNNGNNGNSRPPQRNNDGNSRPPQRTNNNGNNGNSRAPQRNNDGNSRPRA